MPAPELGGGIRASYPMRGSCWRSFVDPEFRMHAERTPNPDSIKWVLGKAIAEPGVRGSFPERVGAEVSPLAARLFAVPAVRSVFFALDFITVTKASERDWPDIAQDIIDAIKAHVESGEPAVGPEFDTVSSDLGGDVAQRIQEILDQEIRPAVAMDGGDVVFAGFQDGRVELYLQGACSGCPSSTATLKFGIEARLREAIPEVVEVVAV